MCISLLTGFLFAAGVYNHFLFLVPVGALCFAALVSVGWPLLRSSAIWISGVGFIASVLLFRYAIFPRPDAHQGKGAEERIERIFSFKFLDDFPNAIRIFGNVLDGKLLYQRFCGEVLVEVIPYASTVLLLLVVVSFILPFGADYADYRKRNRVIAIFGIVLFLGLVVVLPALSLRYFLLSSLVFPFLLVSVLSPMLRSEANRQFYISSLFILSISLCNVAYLSVNYFYAFGKSGGRTSEFRLGNRLTETSDHFVATDNLYATLKAKNVEHLVAKIGIVVPILAYDYNTKAIRDVTITHNRKTPSLPDDRDPGIVTAIVKYRKGNGSPFDIEIYGADSKR
jgi:hypothetical protein